MGGIWRDGPAERGQSEVLGAILVFGILVLFVGLLQLYLVPNVVADHEQNHAEQIENDFAGIYSSITSAAGGNSEQSATITLGTRFQVLPALVMPSPASGTVRSETEGTITSSVEDEDAVNLTNVNDGDDIIAETCGMNEVEVRSLHYSANYKEYRNPGEFVTETGIRYKSFSGTSVGHQQRLVRTDGGINHLNFLPLTNGSVNAQGTKAESISFEAGATGTIQTFTIDQDDAVKITIDVNDPDAWERTFGASQGDIGFVYHSDSVEMTLNTGDYQIKCTPVGLNTRPNNSPDSPTPPGTDEEDDPPFNPIGEDDLVYQETRPSTDTSFDAEWSFRNRDDEAKNVTQVRIPWSSNPGLQGDNVSLQYDSVLVPVEVGKDSYTEIPGGWKWDGGEQDFILASYSSARPNTDFMLILKFEDGSTSSYIISSP